ncbi:uncharacterized protein LOC125491730 [Beta vulgaris subsp. vulgaris]|uniref:uncharacterized protein LOC125491730 n=1 Tax=Beta vulgaris subsp. vulgaris TaxID=3555 RepID=UPI002036A324|nr:uncharacterized protein LOC125491730 [Beta vulgaris subsp. vulgaris]
MRRRLHTADKVQIYDPNAPTDCWICCDATETQEHLMFSCYYSRELLRKIKTWINIESTCDDLHRLVRWIYSSRKSRFQKAAYGAAIAGVVYGVWKARNDSKSNQRVPSIQHMESWIKENVRRRIFLVMPRKISRNDRNWFYSL